MDALGTRHTMPSFETFCDQLTQEQEKLQQMDASGSSSQALVAQSSQGKPKQKAKPKKDSAGNESSSKPAQKTNSKPLANPSKGKSSSKSIEPTSKTKKKSVETYSFCRKDGHLVSRCWKCLEALEEAMQEHHISAPQSASSPIGKGHALTTRATTSGPTCILDSNASHHMTHTQQLVTSLAPCATSQIVVGNSSHLSILGSCSVALVGGSLQDVLCVPHISMNLLSIYQIFHSSSGKIVEFSPHDVVIQDLHDSDIIVATGSVDTAS